MATVNAATELSDEQKSKLEEICKDESRIRSIVREELKAWEKQQRQYQRFGRTVEVK